MAGAEQSIYVGVRPEALFSVITDYESYPQFLSDMEAAKVISREGPVVEVEFTLNLIKRIRYTLRLTEEPPNRVSWTLVDGMFKRNDGSWKLAEQPDGRTKATYRIDVGVGVFLPGAIVHRLVGQTLPATLESFRDRAEAQAVAKGPGAQDAPAPGEAP